MTNRPEVGVETRNRLCKLLTSPVNAVSQIVAEFLFILCKESGKYVKKALLPINDMTLLEKPKAGFF